jgi:hypothetical protein
VHRSAGDLDAAHGAWTLALRIFDEISHPDGDPVRAKLLPATGRLHAVSPGGERGVAGTAAAQEPDCCETTGPVTASLRR